MVINFLSIVSRSWSVSFCHIPHIYLKGFIGVFGVLRIDFLHFILPVTVFCRYQALNVYALRDPAGQRKPKLFFLINTVCAWWFWEHIHGEDNSRPHYPITYLRHAVHPKGGWNGFRTLVATRASSCNRWATDRCHT